MNSLNFAAIFAFAFGISSIYAASLGSNADGQTKPPIFNLERPLACENSINKEKFIMAMRESLSDPVKLAALFSCSKTIHRIAELTETDVRLQGNEIPDSLRAELQKILDKYKYGSLQNDNDLSFIGCIDHIKNLLPSPNICVDKIICKASDLDAFFSNTQKSEHCAREFIKDKLTRMVDVVKAMKGLMSPESSVSRTELVGDLQNIIKAIPYKNIAELAQKSVKQERVMLDVRSKLEGWLSASKKDSSTPTEGSDTSTESARISTTLSERKTSTEPLSNGSSLNQASKPSGPALTVAPNAASNQIFTSTLGAAYSQTPSSAPVGSSMNAQYNTNLSSTSGSASGQSSPLPNPPGVVPNQVPSMNTSQIQTNTPNLVVPNQPVGTN